MRYNPNIGQIKEIEIIKELMHFYGMQFFDGGKAVYLYSDRYVVRLMDYVGENYLELLFWDLDNKYKVVDGTLEGIAEEIDEKRYAEIVNEHKVQEWPNNELAIFDEDSYKLRSHKLRYLYYYAMILMFLKEYLDNDKMPKADKCFMIGETFVDKLLCEKNSRPSK